jgi:hypothetical protein
MPNITSIEFTTQDLELLKKSLFENIASLKKDAIEQDAYGFPAAYDYAYRAAKKTDKLLRYIKECEDGYADNEERSDDQAEG